MRIISTAVAVFERLCANMPWFFELYAFPYRALVARELQLAGVRASDTVLSIGCGALPFTAVLTARISGARVIGVDRDRKSALRARRTVARLGLQADVTILEADAASDRLPAADVALVALQAAPKPEILRNLSRSHAGCDGGRIVFRLPRARLAAEYGTLDSTAQPAAGMVRHLMPTFGRSELHLVSGAGSRV